MSRVAIGLKGNGKSNRFRPTIVLPNSYKLKRVILKLFVYIFLLAVYSYLYPSKCALIKCFASEIYFAWVVPKTWLDAAKYKEAKIIGKGLGK